MGINAVVNSQSQNSTTATGKTANVVPFCRATRSGKVPFFDTTYTWTAGQSIQVGPVEIAAQGFMRSVLVEVTATGGSGSTTAAVNSADGPFNVFSNFSLNDVNGSPIYGPLDGYNMYLAQKWGGYQGYPDPRNGIYSAPASTGNFTCVFRVPVEIIARSGLGDLPNTNAAAAYKINCIINPPGTVYSTVPAPTIPNIRVRMFLEYNTQPAPTDVLGNMNATSPPNMGTTQFWTQATYTLASGSNTTRLLRVGNYIRNLIFVLRNSSGVRIGVSNWPDPLTIQQDGFQLDQISADVFQDLAFRNFGYASSSLDGAGDQDTGVFAYPFTTDLSLTPGNELRHKYLPTLESTRLLVIGTYGSTATQLTVLTNDISPSGDIFTLATL